MVREWEEKSVDVLGTRVHYLYAGSGRPLLLIHGLVSTSLNWRKNIGALAENATVYAINLTNADKTGRITDLDTGLEATADRVAATMDALGIKQADIVGHSHGGAVSLMLAARHPQRVRSLILFAPANPFCSLPGPMIRLYTSAPGKLLARLVPYLPRPIHQMALKRMYGDPARIGEGCIEEYIDGLRSPGRVKHILAIVHGWFANMLTLKLALPLVAGVPTLLLWGDRDRALSVASGVRLSQQLGRAELIVVGGGGHVVFEEMPEQSNRLMLDWLSRDVSHLPLASRAPDLTAPRAATPRSSRSPQAPQLSMRISG
jgi:pimeloyl-ACP methyl ester carboxylesterase